MDRGGQQQFQTMPDLNPSQKIERLRQALDHGHDDTGFCVHAGDPRTSYDKDVYLWIGDVRALLRDYDEKVEFAPRQVRPVG